MKATMTVDKKEVTKTVVVEVVETPMFTLTLNAEEAMFLRTSAYAIIYNVATPNSKLFQFYKNLFDVCVSAQVKADNYHTVRAQLKVPPTF